MFPASPFWAKVESMTFKLLLFDLDGTLIDSRDDLADSVNLMLADLNFPQIPPEFVYDFIGNGVVNLISRSLAASLESKPDEQLTMRAVEVFKEKYDANCLVKTRLYDGVAETLEALKDFKKAVITNKPRDFSVKILDALGIASHFEAINGGDSFSKRKPNAMPLVETAKSLGVSIENCVMIGDSRVDIEAGKNAGVTTVGCTFGFRGRGELEREGADYFVERFGELKRIFVHG